VADLVGDTSGHILFSPGVAIIDLVIDMISRRITSIFRMIVDAKASRGWVSALVLSPGYFESAASKYDAKTVT